jgi:predicted 2-oxoglutarate/Fe(II)-dependent dioxygenase YbiX
MLMSTHMKALTIILAALVLVLVGVLVGSTVMGHSNSSLEAAQKHRLQREERQSNAAERVAREVVQAEEDEPIEEYFGGRKLLKDDCEFMAEGDSASYIFHFDTSIEVFTATYRYQVTPTSLMSYLERVC